MLRAALSALVGFAAASCMQPAPAAPPMVALRADRCAGQVSIDPRRAVVMLLDVSEYSPGARFDVELVDHEGNRVDAGAALEVSAATVAYACHGLNAGVYFLRLRENGSLRREYKISAQPGADGC